MNTLYLLDSNIIFVWFLKFTVAKKVLIREETSPYQTDKIPVCHGTERNLVSCLKPISLNKKCNFLLVECKDSLNKAITDVPSSTITDGVEKDRGILTAVFAGVIGVLVVIITLITGIVLLFVLRKGKKSENLDFSR